MKTKPDILYLDCFSGIAGDMFIGALLDMGVGSLKVLETELSKIDFDHWSISVDKVQVSGISASRFSVTIDPAGQEPRSLAQIESLIAESDLSERVKSHCVAIFSRVARAEAEAHGESLETVHFHEIGMVDSIIDIVGTCILIERLSPSYIMSSPVTLGSGTVETEHGRMPVPAPATAIMLKGLPVQQGSEHAELATPTGAALVSYFADAFGPLPGIAVESIGYGAGGHETDRANVLRMMAGQRTEVSGSAEIEQQMLLETNIDDSTPEELGFLVESLLAAGAADAWVEPVQMKKGRPGVVLCVLCPEPDMERYLDLIFTGSSTFGIRATRVERHCLSRTIEKVQTAYGAVAVKIGRWRGRPVSLSPEYEDCRHAAIEHNVPIKEVYAAARTAAADLLQE